jgi:AcrR family transcriptional regulator
MRPLPPDRRAAVLGGAIRVFAQRGYRGASMSAIAAATELSRPALYQYFADKEAIFRAAVAWSLDGLAHDITERARAGRDTPPRARLDEILSQFLSLYDGPELSRIRAEMIDETYVHAGDLWVDFERRVLAALGTVIASVEPAVPADELAVVLLHGAEGIVLKSQDRSTRERRVGLLLDLVLSAEGDPSHSST